MEVGEAKYVMNKPPLRSVRLLDLWLIKIIVYLTPEYLAKKNLTGYG